jgi:hypothetical protein
VTAELNIHLEDPASSKTVRRELHKSNIDGSGRAAIPKPLITENNGQMRKRRCHDRKTWTPDNWKHVTWSRCSLHPEEFTFGEHPRKSTIRNVWFDSKE